jgi:histidinol-phosphate phosphatase family protein
VKPVLALDRDGVLNQLLYDTPNGRAPRVLSEITYLVDPSGIKRLAEHYEIIVITNQPDSANGVNSLESQLQVHYEIMEHFDLAHSYMCTHKNDDNCECRKPRTGLLELTASPKNSTTLVGDRWTDVAAGKSIGWKTILLKLDSFSFAPNSVGEPPQNLKPDVEITSWESLLLYLLNIRNFK